ncbi:hypothetical protein ACFFQF_20030 [Haladaptatus pallidirubidus]|uniref:Amphi-Trp domain-containing protein n=1 Tax=Haladaptatus pallidirubidus TaxID=1008152 RepID=A0AAV3UPB0_9EURY|nr:hypothetical protein [Haladaptatus pallidirubidus]
MPELDVEFEKNRAEVAAYLRDIANKLETTDSDSAEVNRERTESSHSPSSEPNTETTTSTSTATNERNQKVTIIAGNDSATVNPPETLNFGIIVDSDSSLMESGVEESITLSMKWASEEVKADQDLSVH